MLETEEFALPTDLVLPSHDMERGQEWDGVDLVFYEKL
jgi:hypothetical protein